MSAVSNLLDSKGRDVLTVSPDTSVREAVQKMEDISAGTALVMEGDEVAGIISERDVIRKVVLLNKDIDQVLVKEIMTTNLTSITQETSLDDCMQLITDKRIRHLPVICGGVLCGIVSIGDVVKYLIVEK
ncbi:MAG: CBS domain-containing protein, partial [Verrucomicrobiota bacterium]